MRGENAFSCNSKENEEIGIPPGKLYNDLYQVGFSPSRTHNSQLILSAILLRWG